MENFESVLSLLRNNCTNTVQLGTNFQKVAKVFLENDPIYGDPYSKVMTYSDWAKHKDNYMQRDTGIDLVAKLKYEEGYCAIQCKCYDVDHSIGKADLDTFISASFTKDFSRMLLIDTTKNDLRQNAQITIENLDRPFIRINYTELDRSNINWELFINKGEVSIDPKKELRPDQHEAFTKVTQGLAKADRGKLIMACGTGKTLTSLRIAEDIAGVSKQVLYMVPSLALMSQSIREWKNDAVEDFTAFAVCSDSQVGKKRGSDEDDNLDLSPSDLAFPATTNAEDLAQKVQRANPEKMIVVFSTYHSIDVISHAQTKHNLGEFDLIICDEAHRTTGHTWAGEDESHFVKVHYDKNIRGKKRLYMTATQRIYGDKPKKKEEEGEVVLASMDDPKLYGKPFYHGTFGEAVDKEILSDYKVIVLTMDEQEVSDKIQSVLKSGESELQLDDATKIVGCYKALAKQGLISEGNLKLSEDETKPLSTQAPPPPRIYH